MKAKRIMALLLAAVMTITPALPAVAAETHGLQNPVLKLEFDNNLNDGSGKGNNGILSAGDPEYVEGVKGKALKLNGSSYVNLGTNTDLQPENLTLSFWMKPNTDMGTEEQIITWNKKGYNTDGWYVSSPNEDQPLLISVGPASGQPYNVAVTGITRSEFFKIDEWTHVVVTYNKETKDVKFYRNGKECRTVVNFAITGDATGVLGSDASMEKSIGYNGPEYKSSYLNASLDSYQLYNAVATQKQVIALYEESGKTVDKKASLSPSSIMGDVTLQDAYLVNASQKEVDYLLSMNSKKFLYEFYRVAGLTPPTDSGYGGWERTNDANFRGHTFGHYMSALSQAYLSSDNAADKEKLMEQIKDAVYGLEECQNAYGAKYPEHAGYISAFPEGCLKRIDGVDSPTGDDGSLIVPYYNLHKVLAGLIDISKNVDDGDLQERALAVAEGFGEFLYNRLSKLADKNKMLSIEYGGMNEALYELYNLTGNDHYKTAAQYFDETNLFNQLANGQDVLNGKHANTTIPKFVGAVKRYTVLTENKEYYNALTDAEKNELGMYLTAAEKFWDIVIKDHTYVTGGNSQSEHFHEAGKIGADATKATYDAALTCETCNTYNMLKLSKALYHVTGEKKYMDYFENTYINAIVSSQNPETGTTMYFQPMAPGYNKVFNRPHDEFWCCTGTGMENFSKLGDNIYSVSGSDIFVHMFFSSEITDATNNVKLIQEAKMPNKDTVTFTVATAEGGSVKTGTKLKLRKPDWLAGTAEIKVNDKAINLKEDKGYYVVENVKAGDKISYQMPMKVQVYDMPDNPNMVSFKYGPVVLSTALGTDNIERSAGNGILVRVGTKDANAKTTILLKNYTDVEAWKKDIEKNLVRIGDSADGKVQFKLQNTDSPELIYTPHYMRYKESYGLYMFIEEEDSQASQNRILAEKEALRKEEMANDSLYTFDNNNYEFNKNLKTGGQSGVGTFSEKQYRDASGGGWFSYELKIDPNAGHNYLNCTFYSGDRGRTFDISVNETKIETYSFKDAPSANDFFVHTIEIPKNLIGNADKMTVKFSSVNNGLVGGLFGISTSSNAAYSTDAVMKGLSFDKGTLSPKFEGNTTEYTLTVPKGTKSVNMTAKPNVESGLIYVNGILIDDTKVRKVSTEQSGTVLRIESKAQDHETGKIYNVRIVESGTSEEPEIPEVLADFNFDADGSFFGGGNAKATGSYTLTDHGNGKALKLNGNNQFLTVTDKNGGSLLTGVKEMTVSYQIKPENSKTNWGFFAAPNADNPVFEQERYLGIADFSGTTRAERYNNNGSRPESASAQTGYDGWYYVTVVYTQNATRLYINGEQMSEKASTYALTDILGDNSVLYIGKATWGNGEYATGLIDNYKIVSKALTAAEVKVEAAKYVEKDPEPVEADKIALKKAIDTKVDAEETYTAESWKVYKDALSAANAVYNKKGATQAEVDAAAKALTDAVKALKKKPVVVEADKTALQKAINTKVDAEDTYTAESWKVYKDALSAANAVYNKKGATQAEVDAAVKALADAQKALEEKPKRPFVDVDKVTGNWYYDEVYYNYDRGIMNGVNPTHFEPLSNLARAQFAIILHNMEGKPAVSYEPKFKDVAEGEWYTNAILWASSKEIVTGYTDGSEKFGWGDNILREQMAVMMYRYAKNFKKYDVSDSADFDNFADAALVDDYAKEAMKWAVGTGIISGKDLDKDGISESIDPQGNATRAECAIIIQRFLEKYEK